MANGYENDGLSFVKINNKNSYTKIYKRRETKIMKETKVVKFGGSSLADAKQFKKVADIILADPTRRFVVASAPGKRFVEDIKVQICCIKCYELLRR